MIRCLIDADSFDAYPNPHDDLEALSTQIELICEIIREEKILILPDTFNVIITCNPELVNWESPGMHCPKVNTVYLSGVYELIDLTKFLCHELIHVEQKTMGWLEFDDDEFAITWFGIPMQYKQDIPDEEYRNYPWERDAYRREGAVYRELTKAILGEPESCQRGLDAIRSDGLTSELIH